MECNKVKKVFKVIGIKGSGKFEEFGTEVPKLAGEFLGRRNEIPNATDTEIALFEPKRGADHVEGTYYVGLLMNETPEAIPSRMEYVEESRDYVTVRGDIKEIGSLHQRLSKWSEETGHQRDTDALIVETYHPMRDGGEEVEIYLPII